MQTIQYQSFGQSDVLALAEVAQAQISNDNEVLIQVKAASVNPLDIKIRMGFMQKMRPVQLPFTPGLDAAGIVVAVGAAVSRFKVGDEVMAATTMGAYAEYVIAKEESVSFKPNNVSFSEAASLVVNLGTAQSILFSEGKLESGQKVLIQGAAGAVGATMVQLAKNNGIYVIATASGKGLELVKELGADEVIDYKSQDLTTLVNNVDLVADCAGGEAQSKLFEVVKSGGKLLSIAGMPSPELAQKYNIEARFVSSNLSAKSLENGLSLVLEGKIKPIIAKTFPLAEAAQAQDFVSAGGMNGKVVLEMG
ncbi:MAG: NADP-dependent oxidoreductase [Haliscomenobacter sp.]|uniref:NADP-dependent oxidoreductase n=1 Tax=Haliscomenobacter sp. TaxID=2717303 RepID=UPI0029AB9A84|nr:NADP-dependent oxidoreductase [Haliscomenobacter sp.]MDX2070087.1 NADP-dependent oxidoreductase [Haliscomenobacter sp.]